MNYASDNVGGCCPEIMAALAAASRGASAPYGADDATAQAEELLRRVFDKPDLKAFLVATGTAANALALSALCMPWQGVVCHAESHIALDECNAPTVLGGGIKALTVSGPHGKATPEAIEAEVKASRRHGVHRVSANAVFISQSNECGCVYTPDELAAIGAVCKALDLKFYMDGARFANAFAALAERGLAASPAEASWKLGVDAMSFGATKNGAWAAEAAIFFNPGLADSFDYHRKRTGHLLSKGRFLGVQMAAYLDGGVWLENARRANAMARRLHDGLTRALGVSALHPAEANEVFVLLPQKVREGLAAEGVGFSPWEDASPDAVRFVCGFDAQSEDIDRLVSMTERILAA